jgi:hypothetical protein
MQIIPPTVFRYKSDGDKNGIVFYLGSCGYAAGVGD